MLREGAKNITRGIGIGIICSGSQNHLSGSSANTSHCMIYFTTRPLRSMSSSSTQVPRIDTAKSVVVLFHLAKYYCHLINTPLLVYT